MYPEKFFVEKCSVASREALCDSSTLVHGRCTVDAHITIAASYRISPSVTGRIIKETSEVIWNVLHEWLYLIPSVSNSTVRIFSCCRKRQVRSITVCPLSLHPSRRSWLCSVINDCAAMFTVLIVLIVLCSNCNLLAHFSSTVIG